MTTRAKLFRRLDKAAREMGCSWVLEWAPANGMSAHRASLVDPYGAKVTSRLAREAEGAAALLLETINETRRNWGQVAL